ncbi:hypothetical protein [Nonomuraea bangladeshensis]|uniref:hypothetical protein n=1 Tax=Nonomuraea bangladeshensis TaxID=404385 RepID=UPI003C2EEF9D
MTLPLLFVFPETETNTPLIASVSVVVAVSAALSTFFSWGNNRGTYRGQDIAIGLVVVEWELSMMELLPNASDQESKRRALEVTREAVRDLFEALQQEHDSIFSVIQSPDEIIDEIKRKKFRGNQAGF